MTVVHKVEQNQQNSRHRRKKSVKLVEVLRQRNSSYSSLASLFRQIDCSRPECHLDLDDGGIAVIKQVLGLAGVDAHHAKEQVARCTQCKFHLQETISASVILLLHHLPSTAVTCV